MNNLTNGRVRTTPQSFTMVSNTIIQDESISLKTIGLFNKIKYYAYISEINPEYILYKTNLERHCKEGLRSFDSSWKELKEKGYLKQIKYHENGKLLYEYYLLDTPQTNEEFEKYLRTQFDITVLEKIISINDKELKDKNEKLTSYHKINYNVDLDIPFT